MAKHIPRVDGRLDRRELIAGLGAAALVGPALPCRASAAGPPVLALQAIAGAVSLRPGQSATPISSLVTAPGYAPLRLKRGDTLQVQLENETAVPIALNWHGIDGVAASRAAAGQSSAGAQCPESLTIPLRHAGTFMCDVRLLGDGRRAPVGGARPDRRRERAGRG